MQPLNHPLSILTQAKAKVEGVEGDSIEVEVMAEVVVMVEVEVKIKIKMSIITSPIILLMAMVKMIKPKLLVVFPEDSLSVSIVNSKGLKGVIIGVNF